VPARARLTWQRGRRPVGPPCPRRELVKPARVSFDPKRESTPEAGKRHEHRDRGHSRGSQGVEARPPTAKNGLSTGLARHGGRARGPKLDPPRPRTACTQGSRGTGGRARGRVRPRRATSRDTRAGQQRRGLREPQQGCLAPWGWVNGQPRLSGASRTPLALLSIARRLGSCNTAGRSSFDHPWTCHRGWDVSPPQRHS
jgi:hypothetical protein